MFHSDDSDPFSLNGGSREEMRRPSSSGPCIPVERFVEDHQIQLAKRALAITKLSGTSRRKEFDQMILEKRCIGPEGPVLHSGP